jgi:quinoprotein glucose dehydrogenase
LDRFIDHTSAAVRMAALLALRRLEDPRVAQFLTDPQEQLATEAARAIYDVPIREALPILAKEVANGSRSDLILRRALVANYRLGGPLHAQAVARFAADPVASEPLRIEAIELLSTWTNPVSADPLLGHWWPLAPRDPTIVTAALREHLAGLVAGPPAVCTAALDLAAELGIAEAAEGLLATFRNPADGASRRSQALRALAILESDELESSIDAGLSDQQPAVRVVARELLAERDSAAALVAISQALKDGEILEQQAAFDLLAALPESPQREALLEQAIERLLNGTLEGQLQLEVIEAAERSGHAQLQAKVAQFHHQRPAQDPIRGYRETLRGGDAKRGRALFFYRNELACVRCHKVEGQGGAVGPDLSRVGAEKTCRYLLTSLLMPSTDVDPRYATWELETPDGRIVTGLNVADGDLIELLQADGRRRSFRRNEIESLRMIRQSAMPDDVAEKLTRRELRDLVAFLASLGKPAP